MFSHCMPKDVGTETQITTTKKMLTREMAIA